MARRRRNVLDVSSPSQSSKQTSTRFVPDFSHKVKVPGTHNWWDGFYDHVDSHYDVPHEDLGHNDVGHNDHSDDPHGDNHGDHYDKWPSESRADIYSNPARPGRGNINVAAPDGTVELRGQLESANLRLARLEAKLDLVLDHIRRRS